MAGADGGLVVDWESFVGYGELPWREAVEKPEKMAAIDISPYSSRARPHGTVETGWS